MSNRDAAIIDFDGGRTTSVFVAYAKTLRGEHEVIIRKKRDARTSPQNRFLHGVILTRLAGLMSEAYEETWDLERVKRLLKPRYLKPRTVTDPRTGEFVGEEIPSTADLDVAECSDLIEKLIGFGVQMFDVDVSQGYRDWRSQISEPAAEESATVGR